VIHHGGLRWEVLPGGEEIVRSRDDWSAGALREDFRDSIIRKKHTQRFVFKMKTASCDAVVKVEISENFKRKIRSVYGRCKGRKEWENHLAAFNCDIPIVKPLAFGELTTSLVVQEAVVITMWRDNTTTIEKWRAETATDAGNDAALEVARQLGWLTARTQHYSLYHNEIHYGNVLIESTNNGPQLLLIDWKHARIKRRTTKNDLRNLIRTGEFYALRLPHALPTESEKKAFLAAYLKESADRPDRAELLAMLRQSCPDAAWIDQESDT